MGITVPLTIGMALLPGANDLKHASAAGIVMLFVVYGAAFAIQAVTRPIIGIALTLSITTSAFDRKDSTSSG